MKRFIAVILVMVCTLSFAACSTDEASNTNPQFHSSNQPTNSEPNNTSKTTEPNDTVTDTENTNQYGVLQNMIEKHGFLFSFRNTEGMNYYRYTFSENDAEYQYSEAGNGFEPTSNLSWNIDGDKLTVAGAREDSFVLDMKTGIATSLTDGREYRIQIGVWEGDFNTPTWKFYSE